MIILAAALRGLLATLVCAAAAWGEVAPLTVFVVRHAEKAAAPADDPLLGAAGRLRAESLADMLADAGVQAIYSSPTTRTRQTVEPLASRLHLTVRTVQARATAELARRILGGAERVVLVAGHSNTVPEIVRALGGGDVASIGDAEYDNLYIVHITAAGAATTLRLHYGARPAAGKAVSVNEACSGPGDTVNFLPKARQRHAIDGSGLPLKAGVRSAQRCDNAFCSGAQASGSS